MISKCELELQELTKSKQFLGNDSTVYDKMIKYGLNLVSNLATVRDQMDIDLKQRVIGSVFPEKLIISENDYRAAKPNEVMSFIFSVNEAFREDKKEKGQQNADLSTMVPRTGIEPVFAE